MTEYTIKFKYFTATGVIKKSRYGRDGDGPLAVMFFGFATTGEKVEEVLSINLDQYNMVPADNDRQFYVKDYSEHEGLADALEAASIAQKGREKVHFGPFDASAYLMTLSDEAAKA